MTDDSMLRDRAREKLVRVAVAENPVTAEMIRESLTNAGIRCMVKNRDALSATWGGAAGTPWALEVWVLEGDADAASLLLGGDPPPPALTPPSVEAATRRPWWRRWARQR